MSHEAYRRASAAASGPRDAEYRAFAEATRRLIAAGAAREDLRALIAAVHQNRELWARLGADCARGDNRLPEETRARLIALARWVHRHSGDVMRKGASLDALIDVNRILMDGLAGRTTAA